jgi:quercetin dioxygenase-like cupin family protein
MTSPIKSPSIKSPVLRREADVAEVTWDDQRGRVSFRSLIDGDETATSHLTFGTAILEPGGSLAPHRHPPAEIYYILAGSAVMTIDGARYDASAGTGIFIPGNAEHGIVNASQQTVKFLYAFAVDRFSDVAYKFT